MALVRLHWWFWAVGESLNIWLSNSVNVSASLHSTIRARAGRSSYRLRRKFGPFDDKSSPENRLRAITFLGEDYRQNTKMFTNLQPLPVFCRNFYSRRVPLYLAGAFTSGWCQATKWYYSIKSRPLRLTKLPIFTTETNLFCLVPISNSWNRHLQNNMSSGQIGPIAVTVTSRTTTTPKR